MDALDAIKGRRSIRKFLNKDVEQAKLDKILEAATYAPSARNYQSWEFLVIKDKKQIEKIAKLSLPGMGWYSRAPALIIVCADMNRVAGRDEERKNIFSVQDCANATMNLMLAAHSLGLGTCYVGSFNFATLGKELGLPNHIRPLTIVPIGYPAETPQMPARKPLKEVVHFNKF